MNSNQSILKEINPEYTLEGLMLKLKLQYFGHMMGRADSLEKTLILGKIEGRRRRERQRMTMFTRVRPSFSHSQPLPSGTFHKPLILIHQRTDRMKTTITEN